MENTLTLLISYLLLQLTPALAAPVSPSNVATAIFARASDCAAPTRCGRTSDAMLNCNKLGTSETELRRCICTRDPNWETDVMECVLCWEAQPPNYELEIALKYSYKHLCKPGPVDFCESTCTNVWHVYNTCGGLGQDKQNCICRYKYIWESWITKGFGSSCPECLEGNDDKALADEISSWLDWPCEAMAPGPDSDVTDTTTTNSDGKKNAAGRVGGQVGLLWALEVIPWAVYLI